jgi:hypothetical protein
VCGVCLCGGVGVRVCMCVWCVWCICRICFCVLRCVVCVCLFVCMCVRVLFVSRVYVVCLCGVGVYVCGWSVC